MAVPTYDKFIEPILRYLADHPDGAAARDVHDAAAQSLGLSEANFFRAAPSMCSRTGLAGGMIVSSEPDCPRVAAAVIGN